MFIPDPKKISRLADCRLAGYPDEEFESILRDQEMEQFKQQQQNKHSLSKRTKMENCLNEMMDEQTDATDVTKYESFAQPPIEQHKPYLIKSCNRCSGRKKYLDDYYENEEEEDDQEEQENFERFQRNKNFRPGYINNTMSPYNLHYRNPSETSERYNRVNSMRNFNNYPSVNSRDYISKYQQGEYIPVNNRYSYGMNNMAIDNQQPIQLNKQSIFTLSFIVLAVIVFIIIFSVIFCNNHKVNTQLSTLEGILQNRYQSTPSIIYQQPLQTAQQPILTNQMLGDNGNRTNYTISPQNSFGVSKLITDED